MYYDDSYSERRFGIASAVLLAIFVSAALMLIVAALWRPWAAEDEGAVVQPPTITIEEAAEGEEAPAEVDAAPQNP
jgi:hypothetical protein